MIIDYIVFIFGWMIGNDAHKLNGNSSSSIEYSSSSEDNITSSSEDSSTSSSSSEDSSTSSSEDSSTSSSSEDSSSSSEEDYLDIEGHMIEKIDALPKIFFGELDSVKLTAPKVHIKSTKKTWYKFAKETGDKIANRIPATKEGKHDYCWLVKIANSIDQARTNWSTTGTTKGVQTSRLMYALWKPDEIERVRAVRETTK